jgi:excisionase family DNA binding protein
MTPSEFLSTVTDIALAKLSSIGAVPLTASEVEFLTTQAGPAGVAAVQGDPDEQLRSRTINAAVRQAETVASTISIQEAAALLGVDRSRISHRLAGGTLWAFRVGRSPRLPRWQFRDGALLPGLASVVAAIPAGLSAASLNAFMNTPQSELGGVTPPDYLADGGDPQLVADLVAALGIW